MGFARTWAVALVGLEGAMVEVEADIGQTLPAFSIVGLPDGRGLAVKIADGADRARMPVTVQALQRLGVDPAALAGLGRVPVLGGGRTVGSLHAVALAAAP